MEMYKGAERMEPTGGVLAFDEGSHTYTVDGRPVPCVTELVEVYGPDGDDMDEWEEAFERAAERGTICHALLEQAVGGRMDEWEYPDAYEGYAQGIRLFLAEHDIRPLAVETPLYSARLGVAGTPDLLAEFDGRLAILDYKFVSQLAKTKVKAQLNFYRALYEDNGLFVDGLYAVQFRPDGTYRLYPTAMDDTELQAALHIYQIKHKKHGRGRID